MDYFENFWALQNAQSLSPSQPAPQTSQITESPLELVTENSGSLPPPPQNVTYPQDSNITQSPGLPLPPVNTLPGISTSTFQETPQSLTPFPSQNPPSSFSIPPTQEVSLTHAEAARLAEKERDACNTVCVFLSFIEPVVL